MIIVVTVIHIIVSLGLILVVLLQTGKGAEMGAVFGGSSSTIFGSSGAGNFLTRLTTGMAVVFMITSLMLGYFSSPRPSASVFDQQAPAAARPPERESAEAGGGQKPSPSPADAGAEKPAAP